MNTTNIRKRHARGEIANAASIYALITTPDVFTGTTAKDRPTVEDETIWEGVEAGIFRVIGPLQGKLGAIVEMATADENEARWMLDSLVFVGGGYVQAELLVTAMNDEHASLEPVPSVAIPLQSNTSQLVL